MATRHQCVAGTLAAWHCQRRHLCQLTVSLVDMVGEDKVLSQVTSKDPASNTIGHHGVSMSATLARGDHRVTVVGDEVREGKRTLLPHHQRGHAGSRIVCAVVRPFVVGCQKYITHQGNMNGVHPLRINRSDGSEATCGTDLITCDLVGGNQGRI